MSVYLLDINVLIALCDAGHAFHEKAWSWYAPLQKNGWATCPLTENGFVRILGNPANPAGFYSAGKALDILSQFCAAEGHVFWPDDISIREAQRFGKMTQINCKALTDLYLLALAIRNGGCFATFDRKINPSQIEGGARACVII